MGGFLGGIRSWKTSFKRAVGGIGVVKGNGEPEHVVFVKHGLGVRVYLDVVVEVPNAGTEFVGKTNLVEEVRDDRVLRLGFYCSGNELL